MRYPVRRAVRPSAKMREADWYKEGRKGKGRGERGNLLLLAEGDPVLWDNGIPFSSRGSVLTREVLVSPIDDLENKTRSTSERWISIDVDPTSPCFSPYEWISAAAVAAAVVAAALPPSPLVAQSVN